MRQQVGSSRGFWIGLADIDVEGVYLWQSSSEVLDGNEFEAWGTNQPDGVPQENCVAAPKKHYYFW